MLPLASSRISRNWAARMLIGPIISMVKLGRLLNQTWILIENIKYLEQTDTTFNLDRGTSLVLKQKWANVKRLEKIHNKQRKINWVVWMAFKLTSEE